MKYFPFIYKSYTSKLHAYSGKPFYLFHRAFSSLLIGILLGWANLGGAQVVRDTTLRHPSIVRSTGNTFAITGGTRQGTNLFHSFRRFSPRTHTASFQDVGLAIDNIFVRVTGLEQSRINGTLEVRGTDGGISSANLFLLNPNGILFGPHAALNLGGSFLATTATQINFDNNIQFSAIEPETQPLLTVSAPIGLQFGGNPGRIVNQSVAQLRDGVGNLVGQPDELGGLQVRPGQTLALVGGNIDVLGGGMIAGDPSGTAIGGRIELGSVASPSQVALNSTQHGLTLKYGNVENFGTIRLQSALLNTSGTRSDTIHIRGGEVTVDNSVIFAQTLADQTGRGIFMQASQLTFDHQSLVSATTTGSGKGGDIRIETNHLAVRHGAQIEANVGFEGDQQITRADGQGGNLWVSASDSIEVSGQSSGLFVRPTAENTTDRSRSGTLSLFTDRLSVLRGGQISTTNLGAGHSGNMIIQASDINLDGVGLDAKGQPIFDINGFPIVSGLIAGADENAIGDGGNLTVTTQRLNLHNGAVLQTSTLGDGRAGNLTIRASEIEVNGVASGGRFPTGILALSGGIPGTAYRGFGNATGRGGDLAINTRVLSVQDGAVVATGSLNSRQAVRAGNLAITADVVSLDNQAGLLANTNFGNGGNLTLNIQDLLVLRHGGNISTTSGIANKNGNGGNITLDAANGFLVTVPNEDSDIVANAFAGQGGNISLTTQGNFGIEARRSLPNNGTNDISASSTRGISGTVTLNRPNVDPIRGATVLPSVPAVPALAQGCQVSGGQSTAEFFNTGRGGLPSTPYESLSSNDILDDVRLPSQETAPPDQTTSRSESTELGDRAISEAKAWVVNDQGQVVLVAETPAQFQGCQLR
ncbi:MAG: filamentous hemagglutinin N-terminal domain-containing protein [Cyanobacteria bacterium CAN_BIN43]|nr:filamentous hemagglutinin N-terminal domain-containing protein [Cyanobacteria bacterium CAN_BIN43]